MQACNNFYSRGMYYCIKIQTILVTFGLSFFYSYQEMNKNAMEPFGQALLAYHAGDTTANLIIRRDDGMESTLPVGHFFA